MTKTVMPIREQKLQEILEDFEKSCDSTESVCAGTHRISYIDLAILRTKIIQLINEEYLI